MQSLSEARLAKSFSTYYFWQVLPLLPNEYRHIDDFFISDSTRNEHFTIKTQRMNHDFEQSYTITVFDESVLAEMEISGNIIPDSQRQIFTSLSVKSFDLAQRFHYSALEYLNNLGF